jgi:arsenite transporter
VTHQTLEKNQVFIYLAAIVSGLIIGASSPRVGELLETALLPVLGLLLYTTFTQVPMSHLRNAFVDSRFLGAAMMGNFVLIPCLVWGLMFLAPDDPAIRLGVLMVLLVPCTDWFITFTQLGGGDARRAIAFAPISLLLQIILLPLFLWIFLGEDFAVTIARGEMLLTFLGLIVAPLIAAFLTEKWAAKDTHRIALQERLGWLPVPLLRSACQIHGMVVQTSPIPRPGSGVQFRHAQFVCCSSARAGPARII